MSLEKLWEAGPEGPWRVYLAEKGGGERVRDFESRRSANKYLRRRHDSVVSYKAYLLAEGGEAFIREGRFKPRSAERHRRDKARLRRKRRARRRAREAARKAEAERRPTRW